MSPLAMQGGGYTLWAQAMVINWPQNVMVASICFLKGQVLSQSHNLVQSEHGG